ncbi:hypothetical protein K1I32_08610 [Chryseobacterium sp. LJ756]|nr:hypothetical protein [Chryseobacterium sp. LJ756]
MVRLANDKTQELLLLDERRDNVINGIYYFLLGYTYHYIADQKNKAQLLLTNMVLYGSGISRLNYQAETSTVNNLSATGKTSLSLQMPSSRLILTRG